ncbi:MAG: hypothetical protein WCV90_01630 [Candidatus Woesearchaeota archaeon]|jgi:hypothetical protein
MDLYTFLKPENEVEERIISDDRFKLGCEYGLSRPGHPEGKTIFHIREVLDNIDKYSQPIDRSDLRLVGLVHDTFKYLVNMKSTVSGDKSHGMLARRFIQEFVSTPRVLETIELHDSAYRRWLIGNRGNWVEAEDKARKLITKIGNNIDFYLTFYNCDNKTGDKTPDHYDWFKALVGINKL